MSIIELGPTTRSVCERVWAARRHLRVCGTSLEDFTVQIAQDLWAAMMIEGGELCQRGTMFGLKVGVDRTLNDDQIRLRHEVIA